MNCENIEKETEKTGRYPFLINLQKYSYGVLIDSKLAEKL